jgi:hypothetical protein
MSAPRGNSLMLAGHQLCRERLKPSTSFKWIRIGFRISPGVPDSDGTLDGAAAAVIGLVRHELIASLSIETESVVQFGGHAGQDFHARCILDQLHLVGIGKVVVASVPQLRQ